MRAPALCLVLCLTALGCQSGLTDLGASRDAGAPPPPPPHGWTEPPPEAPGQPACMPDAEEWRAVRRLHNVAEASVHELVTCGGAQLSTISSMILLVLLSNPEFFDPSTLEEVRGLAGLAGLVTDVPFEHAEDGQWTMPINERSTFSVRFLAPEAAEDAPALTENVFDLESYLEGAHIRSTLSWAEMKADLDAQNIYTLTWERPGPLAALLFPEGVPASGQVEIRLSIMEFLTLFGFSDAHPDFGPFAHLTRLGMDSSVHLVDEREGITVDYTFAGERGTLGDLGGAGRLGFELEGLTATDGGLTLVGEAGDLAYLRRGTLAGELVYHLEGGSTDLRVVDDFGAGASYPNVTFECP